MNRLAGGSITDFFGRNHQEAAPLLHQAAKLCQWLEPNGSLFTLSPPFHPGRPEAGEVFVDYLITTAFADSLLGHPPVADGEHVVIGKRQEVITTGAVPLGDHLGKIIPVTPERVRVEVAFPPPRSGICRNGLVGTRRQAPASGQGQHQHPQSRCLLPPS
jgi:hypothetical protein